MYKQNVQAKCTRKMMQTYIEGVLNKGMFKKIIEVTNQQRKKSISKCIQVSKAGRLKEPNGEFYIFKKRVYV